MAEAIRYSDEQKAHAAELLSNGVKIDDVVKQTGISKSTVSAINKKLKGGTSKTSSYVNKLKDELKLIVARRKEIEKLISGDLLQELEDLKDKELFTTELIEKRSKK